MTGVITKYNQKVYDQYSDVLTSFDDLIGDGYTGMSSWFYLHQKKYLHWLSNDPHLAIRQKEVRFRRRFYTVLSKIGPKMLKCSQVFENRKWLNDNTSTEDDPGVTLPDVPVIFVSSHGFYDDALASSLAAGRPAWFFWGSLPLLYNTFNGVASALVGAVVVNRKSKNSRVASIEKALKVMEYGSDVILYPEGGWNKTMESLVLPLWSGAYKLSCAGKCSVVPIIHYVRDMEVLDKKNIIHTVVDDPIPLFEMPQDEALMLLRDVMATWRWKMMEAYGQSTRASELDGFSSVQEKWDKHLEVRMSKVQRYDSTVERFADYRPGEMVRPEDVWAAVAQIRPENITAQNIKTVQYARDLCAERERRDFQRRY